MVLDNEVQIILSKMKLFKSLSDDELKIVAPYGKRLKIDKSKKIINEGEANPGLHILISGEMEVLLSESNKKHSRLSNIHLCKMERGDYVGEYSIIDHEPACATVVAKEPCHIFYISCKKFEELVDNNMVIANKVFRNMLEVLVKRARNYDQELDMIL